MSAKIPGWDNATDDEKLDLLHDWLMKVSDRLQQHTESIQLLHERVRKLEK